ncbi:Tyrosine-protein phosphatase YwqE [bioreactor metagenome]|uniref:Tyrosine-protein phosphatase YwqE n=1 Tax=bioreactor metagenome TaxID=1076179 RepID=A0A645D0H3_9ZZZZ
MIDFHSHILPGIDDGAKNMDISLNMLKLSISEGVEHICATPHFIPGEHEINKEIYFSLLTELQSSIGEHINIVSGLEVYIDPKVPELYKEDKIWCINNKKYMLLELPMNDFPLYTEDVFYELRLLGITPILAHPERNLEIMKDEILLKNLIDQGALAQINSGSLRGKYGERVQVCAENLVKKNLIHLVGSDGHNASSRKTKIKEGFEIIERINKPLYDNILLNEKSIILGEDIEILPIKEEKERKSFSIFNIFRKK